MKIIKTSLSGCLVLEPKIFDDAHGFFFEQWNARRFAEYEGLPTRFAQSSIVSSRYGVLRGLHYQWPKMQGKLVSVLAGEIYDVALDVRHGSPTFGHWSAVVLSERNRRQFCIPEGFAHGFVVLSETALLSILGTTPGDAQGDARIRWNDAQAAIDWPISRPVLSRKDATAPFLDEIDIEQLPHYPVET